MIVSIREEQPDDIAAVREVNEQAFGQSQEADIVDALRKTCGEILSLVALADDRVVGHLLLSPVLIANDKKMVSGMGLGPMAVIPGHQRQGIGGRLIQYGIERLRESGCPFIVVLGHPSYYPRFGFELASSHGIRSEWEVPEEAFMVLVLDRAKMEGSVGIARYRPEFSSIP